MKLEEQQRLLLEEDANARENSEKAYAEKIEAQERQDELRAEHYICAVGAREKAAEVEQVRLSSSSHFWAMSPYCLLTGCGLQASKMTSVDTCFCRIHY
jgi:hypothetical protein